MPGQKYPGLIFFWCLPFTACKLPPPKNLAFPRSPLLSFFCRNRGAGGGGSGAGNIFHCKTAGPTTRVSPTPRGQASKESVPTHASSWIDRRSDARWLVGGLLSSTRLGACAFGRLFSLERDSNVCWPDRGGSAAQWKKSNLWTSRGEICALPSNQATACWGV